MPIDDWLIFAYVIMFTSVLLCGIIPAILRLRNDRRRFHRYKLERQAIEYSYPHIFLTTQLVNTDVQYITDHPDLQYEQIPYIDDDTSI